MFSFLGMEKIEGFGCLLRMICFRWPLYFFSLTRYVVVSHTNRTSLWRMKDPLRIIVVGWMTLLGGILTMWNLRHHWVVVVTACIMCLVGKELIVHLLLDRRSAQCLWRVILGWFQFCGPLPNSILVLFKYWRLGVGSKGWRTMWLLSFLAGYMVHLKRKKLEMFWREIL